MHAEEISDKYHDPENFFLPAIQIYGAAEVVQATANTL
jgi:hypothetical protein